MRNSRPPIFTFSGLDPRRPTSLAVQTISTTDGVEDSPYVFLESRATAAQGATPAHCVSMRFDRLKWCGDHMFKAYGLRPASVGGTVAPDAAANTLTNANTGGSSDVFNTHSDAFRADRGVAAGMDFAPTENIRDTSELGSAKQAGILVTPKLSGLGQPTDVRISFRLGNWNEPNAVLAPSSPLTRRSSGSASCRRTSPTPTSKAMRMAIR